MYVYNCVCIYICIIYIYISNKVVHLGLNFGPTSSSFCRFFDANPPCGWVSHRAPASIIIIGKGCPHLGGNWNDLCRDYSVHLTNTIYKSWLCLLYPFVPIFLPRFHWSAEALSGIHTHFNSSLQWLDAGCWRVLGIGYSCILPPGTFFACLAKLHFF